MKRKSAPIQNPDRWGNLYYSSGPGYIAWYKEPPDDDALLVSGRYIDSILHVSDVDTSYGVTWEDPLKE